MCLSLLYSNPSSSTILINYLYFSLVSVVSVLLSKEESYLSGKFNTTTLLSISLNNKVKSDILYLVLILTYLNFTQILRVIFKLGIIQLLKLCFVRVYSQNRYRSYTCIFLYCIAFSRYFTCSKCHKCKICLFHFLMIFLVLDSISYYSDYSQRGSLSLSSTPLLKGLVGSKEDSSPAFTSVSGAISVSSTVSGATSSTSGSSI